MLLKRDTAVLAQELMHKGDTLSKDPNFEPSEALVVMQRQYSKIPTIIDEGTEAAKQRVSQGDAEHKLSDHPGQAYPQDMESLTGTMENYQRRNIPITDYEAKFTTKADGTVDYDLPVFYRAVDKEDISKKESMLSG